MNIQPSAVGPARFAVDTDGPTTLKAAMEQLRKALGSNNLKASQSAFVKLDHVARSHHRHPDASRPPEATNASSPWADLKKALDAGDLEPAQKAFALVASAVERPKPIPAQDAQTPSPAAGAFGLSAEA